MTYYTESPNWFLSKKLYLDEDLTTLAPTGWYVNEGLARRWTNNNWVTRFETVGANKQC